ncbi:serine hydrolase domain-containing protein [Anaerostipes sp.]|uniref:serine hydrolase domain-containing protein n=1 Tax=Anaerostipes sp. TaxID=1872530 RepID=UPI0025BDA5A2|nr:serine hydrolase [Anaerostipes sp.]MBS7008164.1 serine hydrolase [Anaerostipes sp.]
MLKEQQAMLELIFNLIRGNTDHISKVDFTPQKPSFTKMPESEQRLPRSSPEEQGIRSARIMELMKELLSLNKVDIHQIMILRHGHVIGECHYAPYPENLWHITHSLCKSITGMAVGMLIEDGKLKLDDKILDIFDKSVFSIRGFQQRNLTVEHLLTMTSLVQFNERGAVSCNDWVRGFLDSPVNGTAGSKFEYNSMNTYMLSAIVTELTGESLMDYLKPRLFEPLGITRIFWESCPKGITKGGWGLFLCPEDAAKIGQLCLQKGVWNQRRLVPKQWLEEACICHVETPKQFGAYGYGYQMWMAGRPGSYVFNGMLGQNVLVYPDLDMVIVTNAGSNELFHTSLLSDTVAKYFEGDFIPEEHVRKDPVSYRKLQSFQRKTGIHDTRFPAVSCKGLKRVLWYGSESYKRKKMMLQSAGRFYKLEKQHVGIFPLIMQVFHNNFTDGISEVGFILKDRKFYFCFREGRKACMMEVGWKEAKITELDMHGEPYLVAVKGQAAFDEDGNTMLKLKFSFIEEASSRLLKIRFTDHHLELMWSECPGKDLLMTGLDSIMSEGTSSFLLDSLMEKDTIGLIDLLLDQTISPKVKGEEDDMVKDRFLREVPISLTL